MTPLLVDVALGLPTPTLFQYSVPDLLQEKIAVGKRVFVSVRTRRLVGTIVGISNQKNFEEVKDIDSVIDESPILDENFLALTRWLSDYYLCSWGQAIEAVLPAPFKKGKFLMKSRGKKETDGLDLVNPDALKLTPHQEKAFSIILEKIKLRAAGVFLLHGITGSGKTEIYMHLIQELLKEPRGSIVLVPEI